MNTNSLPPTYNFCLECGKYYTRVQKKEHYETKHHMYMVCFKNSNKEEWNNLLKRKITIKELFDKIVANTL
jgi:hypothetical protein